MTAVLLLLLLQPAEGERVDFGTTTAERVRLLRHELPAVRSRAALLLSNAEPDKAIAALLETLDDTNSGVRRSVAQALFSLGDERAVPFLAAQLAQEEVPGVTAELLLALGKCGGAYVARRVQPYLEHPAREVRAAAAAALGEIGDAGQRDALWAALRYAPDDPDFIVRASILGAFVRLGWKADVRQALGELEEAGALRHWYSRAAMVDAVGAAGIAERTAWVRHEVDTSPDPRVVAAAAGALTRLGHRDEVCRLLGHASPTVRRAALVALQEAGDERAVQRAEVLVREDEDSDVRFEAALVLSEAGHPDADVYLVDALRSRNPLYWMTALAELERRHGRSFGRNPEKWEAWLKEEQAGR